MLKKLSLIVLIGISNIQASDAPKTGFIQKVKNSPAVVKWVGGIIPSIVTCICMEAVRRTYKDNPEKCTLVNIVSGIECISLLIAATVYDWWFKIDFRKWITSGSKKNLGTVNAPQEVDLSYYHKQVNHLNS